MTRAPCVPSFLAALAWGLLACGGGTSGSDGGGGGATGGGSGGGTGGGTGGGIAPVTPMLIDGGGVASAPIAGALNVYAVEAGGATPLVGAAVRVGASDATSPLTGVTSTDGLAAFTDVALSGAQTITVTAPGHAAATWVGVRGANVTIPLQPTPRVTPTAHATGTIAGWNALSAPAIGHYTLGVVLYSFSSDVTAGENRLTQPMNGTTPANTCLRTLLSNTCAWELNTRVGRQVHFAVIVDGDAHGTATDQSDDTYTLLRYAVGPSVTLTAGQQSTGESLALVDANATAALTVSFPTALAGLGSVAAIPTLDLGADGKLAFPLPTLTPGNTATRVLTPAGQFAGRYDLLALATPSSTVGTPYTSGFLRGLDLAVTAAIPAWLPPPSQLTTVGGTFAFTGSPGATLHTATFSATDGSPRWVVSLLDGSTAFSLPALSPDPLAGTVKFEMSAAELVGFDAQAFTVAALGPSLKRAAQAETAFTH